METLNVVLNGQYISYSFETSRLGYLMRRLPAMGIIALFSVERNVIYFEYVDEVYKRLMERGSDEWKQNDKVNIHVPICNVLKTESVMEIHTLFSNRFSQAAKMQASHGAKYGLPTTNLAGDTKYDWNNLDDIKKMLQEYGTFLLNEYDLRIVYDLISRLTHEQIYRDTELLQMAAVTYCEIGMYAEAELYINKLAKIKDEFEKNTVVDYCKKKIDLALGRVTYPEFIQGLREIAAKDNHAHNNIVLEINIINFELLDLKMMDLTPPSLLNRITNVFDKIDAAEGISDGVKLMLKIWNAENYSIWSNRINYEETVDFRMKVSMGNFPSLEERKKSVLVAVNRDQQFLRIVNDLEKNINKKVNEVHWAYLQSLIVRNFIAKQLDYISLGVASATGNTEELVHNRVQLALSAYNAFSENNHFREAYASLCDGIDLLYLSREFYQFQGNIDESQLLQIKREMEKEYSFPIYNPVLKTLIDQMGKNNQNDRDKWTPGYYPFLMELDDDKIDWLATKIINSMKLDKTRLANVVRELKAYQLFSNRCSDKNIEVLQAFNDKYANPIRFVLRSKASGILSSESTDMDYLLTQWGM